MRQAARNSFPIQAAVRFMLDQQRLRFLGTIDDLPDGDADVSVVHARVRLRRLAPAAIQQDVGGLHASGRRYSRWRMIAAR